jgi:hypothetical protein
MMNLLKTILVMATMYHNTNLYFTNLEPRFYPNEGYIATREVLFEKYKPLKLIITSTPIGVAARKLRATWTPQMAEDVAAFHSIDAEAELTALLNPNIENIQTRKVLIEKCKPQTNTIWRTGIWTPEFTMDYHKLFVPPQ